MRFLQHTGQWLRRISSIVVTCLLVSVNIINPAIASPLPCNAQQSSESWCIPTVLKLSSSDNPEQVQYDYYDYIWRTFIALNWPNVPIRIQNNKIVEGFRGEPDVHRNILEQTGRESLALSIWETYREPGSEIFLKPDQWKHYPDWNTPRPSPTNSSPTSETARNLKTFDDLVEYAPDINQPYFYDQSTGPLVDQQGNFVRYEVATNQAFFTYVKQTRYYDANQQKDAVNTALHDPENTSAGFQRPPYGDEPYLKNLKPFAKQGFIDVKAAWRELTPSDHLERYLHRTLIIDDLGTQKMMGLVALHVFRYMNIEQDGKVVPGYVGSTFEQIDNVDASDDIPASFNTGTPASAIQKEFGFEGTIPPQAKKKNPAPQPPVSIYRVTPIPGSYISCAAPNQGKDCPPPLSVAAINQKYRDSLNPSVFAYYQLVGTQNKRPDTPLDFSNPNNRLLNGHEGPITGVYTNTNNLINTALESYTQKNFSCILCHAQARPQGVPEQAFEDDRFKIITFLLNMAHSRS